MFAPDDHPQRMPSEDSVREEGGYPHSASDDVWAVVPVFNEGPVLGEVLAALRARIGNVLCVDDGSSDDSAAVAEASGSTVLRHGINLGQGAALQTGFEFLLRKESVAYVVTFDGDGQHDPDDALRLVHAAQDELVDVVLGTRAQGGTVDQPRLRRLILRAALTMTRVTTGLQVSDTHNGLRVLSRRALTALPLRQPGMAHASELLNGIRPQGLTWVEMPVTISYTAHSRSKGQSSLNAVNVLYDLVADRLQARS